MAVVSAKNVSVTLNNQHILDKVSFDVERGEVVAIIGPNGSGKTTLLKAILGLVPFEGEISVLGVPPSSLRSVSPKIGYVPQRLEFDRTMPVTVEELLAIHFNDQKQKAEAYGVVEAVGASGLLKRRIGVLSGGELQRVLLALALLNGPEILFLDEPASGVDIEGTKEFYSLIHELREEKHITVFLVSHEVDVVFRHATTVLCINHQLLCRGTPQVALTHQTLERLYGAEHATYTHKESHHD